MRTISDYKMLAWDNINYDRLINEVILPFINHQEIILYGNFDSNTNAIAVQQPSNNQLSNGDNFSESCG
jgi:hypothetical protein